MTETLAELRASQATKKQKAKFILATDGKTFEAESLLDGETVACPYPEFPNHFGFFLPLAGITTVHQMAGTGASRGIASLCVGVGQGLATVFERE